MFSSIYSNYNLTGYIPGNWSFRKCLFNDKLIGFDRIKIAHILKINK